MACTHTELCKFARPAEGRFRRLWDQLDIVLMNALGRAESLRAEGRLRESEDEGPIEDQQLRERFAQMSVPETTHYGSC